MTEQMTPFSLILTTNELLWLAGYFGISRLALPMPLASTTDERIKVGQKKLVERGLIRRDPGKSWQVDQLVGFLLHSLANVERYTRLRIYSPTKDVQISGLYTLQGLYLLDACTSEEVEFIFLPDKNKLIDEIFNKYFQEHHFNGKEGYSLIQPVELTRAALLYPNAAREILFRVHRNKPQIDSTIRWLDSVQKVYQFDRVATDPDRGNQLLLLETEVGFWFGTTDSNSEWVQFLPGSDTIIRNKLDEYI